MTTSDWILALTGAGSVLAIFSAPVVALWLAGKLQRRSDSYKAKLDILSTLMGLRLAPLSDESARALNLIDAVFTDEPAVREAWTRYYTSLSDPNQNVGPGYALREEKRRDLLLEIVKALGLARKISSAEVLRAYVPTYAVEATHVALLERMYKRAHYEEELKRRGIALPAWGPTPQPTLQEAAPVSPGPRPPGGNAGKPVTPQTS